MAKNRLSYVGLDNFAQEASERPYYMSFKVLWRESGEVLAEIITNKAGNGRWIRTDCDYRQVAGTAQYSIPRSESGIRKALRVMASERIGAELDTLLMSYVDVPFLTVDDDYNTIENPEYFKAEKEAKKNPKYLKRKSELENILDALG